MRKKYVFITYGSERIKGVQTKAINISEYLPKNEVLVINHGDSSWLKDVGLEVYQINFDTFDSPANIDPTLKKYLDQADVIIYCDFPTNMPLEALMFWYVYKNLKTPICICENIYNESQFQGKIYSIFYQLSDLMLLTGLSLFQNYVSKFPKALLIPPFFSDFSNDMSFYKNRVIDNLNIKNKNNKIIFYIAYNQKVFDISQKIIESLRGYPVNHVLITTSKPQQQSNIDLDNLYTITKKVGISEMRDCILGSDIVVCKFGYQQILESLSIGKPTIAVGDSGLKKSWLDRRIDNAFIYNPQYSEAIFNELTKLIKDELYYKNKVEEIKLLHNQKFNGAKMCADAIMKIAQKKSPSRPKLQKKLLLSFNTKENLKKIKDIIRKEMFIFPIIVSSRFAERDFGYPKGKKPLVETLQDLDLYDRQDFLDPSFYLLLNFSKVAYHGIGPILPFYDNLLMTLEKLLKLSDNIYIVGQEAKIFFENIIKRLSLKRKTIFVS